jgi:opacity protein-like surface antigen
MDGICGDQSSRGQPEKAPTCTSIQAGVSNALGGCSMLRTGRAAFVALAILASSLMAASSAWADGEEGSLKDSPAPPPPQDYVWDGLYIGAGIGAGSFDHDIHTKGSKATTVEEKHKKCVDYDYSQQYRKWYCDKYKWTDWKQIFYDKFADGAVFGDDGWDAFGTIQLGYDRLLHSRFLIGVFTDLDFYIDSEDSFSGKLGGKYYKFASVESDVGLDKLWNVGGRAGLLLNPRILAYAVGGYSRAKLDGSVDVDFKHGPTLSYTPDDMDGYFVGGGAEFKIQRNVSLKFEYRYTHLSGDSGSASATDVDKFGDWHQKFKVTKDYETSSDIDGDIHSVRANLVLKLDRPDPPVEPLK